MAFRGYVEGRGRRKRWRTKEGEEEEEGEGEGEQDEGRQEVGSKRRWEVERLTLACFN